MSTTTDLQQAMQDVWAMIPPDVAERRIIMSSRTKAVFKHHIVVGSGVRVMKRRGMNLSRRQAARRVCAPGIPKKHPRMAQGGLSFFKRGEA